MIPPFTDAGLLPSGIHRATVEEIENRFGRSSDLRRTQMESIHWMLDLAARSGAVRVVLNGSFVTDIMEPNDVDCVLLFEPGAMRDADAFDELQVGLPFLDITLAGPTDFAEFISHVFAYDRRGSGKGMIEVVR